MLSKLIKPRNSLIQLTYGQTQILTRNISQAIPTTASTVIIGGGVTGTSLAYHLSKQGEKDVVLLEKTELTAGSTWHAAGLTTFYNAGLNMKKLHYYSINLYSQLAKETDQDVGYHQVGSLRMAFRPERVQEFQYQMSRSGWHDNPQCLLTPDEVGEMVPFLNKNKLLMGLYNPYDGYIDPYSLTQALAKGARKYGTVIYQQTPVSGLKLNADKKWIVSTPQGNITADRIVNAGGFWAKEIAKLAGVDLPLITTHHQYLVTSPISEIEKLSKEIPVLRHMEGSGYIRQEKNGLVVGIYEAPETVVTNDQWNIDGVPKDFGKELFQSDVDRMMPYLSRISEDLPIIEKASIQTIINGPISYTPDGLPLIGPDFLPNMWTLSGFGYGIIHGGGAGKFLADWIQNGEPSFHLIECDPLRFKSWVNDGYLFDKAHESYGKQNAINYPNEERFAGRPQRITNIYEKQRERGAFMQIHNGWEQPAWFAEKSPAEYIPTFNRGNWHDRLTKEWEMVTLSAGIVDLSPFSKYIIKGSQSAQFMESITANILPKIGRIKLAHMLTPAAKVYAEITITRMEENSFFIITGSGSELHDLRWIKQKAEAGNWNIEVTNVTANMGCLSIAGPKSGLLLEKILPGFQTKFPFMSAKEVILAGIKTLALRLSYTGELGWEFYIPIKDMDTLYSAFLDAGLEFGAGDFGTMTLNTLRLEKGFKMWGAEMNIDTNMVESDLMPFVKLNKGDFIGKEILQKQLTVLPNRKLVMAALNEETDCDPHGNESVWLAGRVVGMTTSGCYSNLLNKSLMFCYVPPYLSTPGLSFEVELATGKYSAVILEKPPTMPYNMRKKV